MLVSKAVISPAGVRTRWNAVRHCLWLAGSMLIGASAAAQTRPAGEAAPATQAAGLAPPSAAEQAALDKAGAAIQAKRYEEVRQILEPLSVGAGVGFDLLINLAGAYDGMALEAMARSTPGPAAREEARKTYEAYAQKAVDNYLRAGLLALQVLDPRAEAIYDRVLRYQPRRPEALQALATLSKVGGRTTQAIFYYKEYLKTERGKGDFNAQISLGALLVDEGLWHQAVDVLEKVRAVGGTEAERHLARAYVAGNQAAKALEILDAAVGREPGDAQSRLLRASLILRQGAGRHPVEAIEDTRAALESSVKAVDANPEDDLVWHRLVDTYMNCERIIQSLRVKASAGELDSNAALGLARLMHAQGAVAARMTNYDIVLALTISAASPGAGKDLLAMVARCQDAIGRIDSAAATAERILKLDPNQPDAKQILEKRAAARDSAASK